MQSPFKIFRKHQKVVLAALTLMAMIGFGLGDTLIKMVRTGPSQQAAKIAVETNVGNLTQSQMNMLMYRRRMIQRFIVDAVVASQPDIGKSPWFVNFIVRRYGFGADSPPEVVVAWLHRHEARQMGISVSDPEVEAYIKEFTNKKLSQKKFFEILEKLQLGPGELYDMFREEMMSVRAFQVKAPASLQSPEKYWEYYQQLNTREKIETAALPVSEFTSQAPEPAEAEVAALFKEHKDEFDSAADGEYKPGFRQPQKVKLHYLAMSFTDAEKKALEEAPITDKEIEAYYEAKKDIDRRMHEFVPADRDDTSPINPEFVPESVKEPEDPAVDGDAGDKPEEKSKESGDKSKKKADEPKDKSSEKAPECGPGLDDDAKPADKTDKPASKSDSDDPLIKSAGKKGDKDAEKKDDASDEDKPAPKPPVEKPSDEDEPAGKESPDDEKPAKTGDKKPKTPPPPKIKYKPLTDELREIIRESLLRERTLKLMRDEAAKVREAMFNVGLQFSDKYKLTDPKPDELKILISQSEEELRKIAGTFAVKFGETGLVSATELSELPDLGKALAREPGSRDAVQGDSASILQEAFSSDLLCKVFEVEGPSSDLYICWKVQNSPSHIPTFDEPGIREQVVAAKKRLGAIELARKRAEDLAAQAGKSGKDDLAEALGSETVTGDPKGLTLTVVTSPEFTFYRESAAPMSFSGPQMTVELGNPIVVNNPGRKFMKYIFSELEKGGVGSAINDDASVCYVVKVISRHDASREAFKDTPLFGNTSPYAQLAQQERQSLMAEFHRRLRDQYAIKWHDVSARDMGPVQYDDE